MKEIILNNNVAMPAPGFGTWRITDDEAKTVVAQAIQRGYRHIDTAEYYKNEEGIGKAICACGVPREELFITSKVWDTSLGYDNAISAFEKSLSRLGCDYLDLYLIHWPADEEKCSNWREVNLETYRALEKLYSDGRVRAIGVSNFLPHQLESLIEYAAVMPMVNQIEFRPGHMQSETVSYCKARGIALEAWRPLGYNGALENPVICEIAEKNGVTPATVCISWVIANGLVPLVKTSGITRMDENLRAIDFKLTDEQLAQISAL